MSQPNQPDSIQEAFARIPHLAIGEVPETMPEEQPRLFRAVCAKRALLATCELAEESPQDALVDLLADLRHLCDVLDLDFAAVDQTARYHYQEEVS